MIYLDYWYWKLTVLLQAASRIHVWCLDNLVVEALGAVEFVVRVSVSVRVRRRRRRRPTRRGRGSLRRQARHRRARAHHGLVLGLRARELLERRRVALREVQLRLHHSSSGRQGPRSFSGVCPPSLGSVRIHVVIDVLFHLGLGGEPPSAVWHRAAERSIALVRSRVLVENRLLPEVFAALRALIGLLTGMYA